MASIDVHKLLKVKQDDHFVVDWKMSCLYALSIGFSSGISIYIIDPLRKEDYKYTH